MIRRAALALAATLALAACAEPPSAGREAAPPAPAARFEPGGGEVREVDLTGDLAARVRGVWVGAYRPYDPSTQRYVGPVAGTARLTVEPRGETLAAAAIAWEPLEGAPMPPQQAIGALTVTGHVMLFNAHFIAFEQDGVTFIEADMMAPDGRFYRHRLVREGEA